MRVWTFLLFSLWTHLSGAADIPCAKYYGAIRHPAESVAVPTTLSELPTKLESVDAAMLKQPESLTDADFFLHTQVQTALRGVERSLNSASIYGQGITNGSSILARLKRLKGYDDTLHRLQAVEEKEPGFLRRLAELFGKIEIADKDISPENLKVSAKELQQEADVLAHLLGSLTIHESDLAALSLSIEKYQAELAARAAVAKNAQEKSEIDSLRISAAAILSDIKLTQNLVGSIKPNLADTITKHRALLSALEARGASVDKASEPLLVSARDKNSLQALLTIMTENPNSDAAKMAAVELRHYPKADYLDIVEQGLTEPKYKPQLGILLDQVPTLNLSPEELGKIQEMVVRRLSSGFSLDAESMAACKKYISSTALSDSQRKSIQQAMLQPAYALEVRSGLFSVLLDHSSPDELMAMIPSFEQKDSVPFIRTILHLCEERQVYLTARHGEENYVAALASLQKSLTRKITQLTDSTTGKNILKAKDVSIVTKRFFNNEGTFKLKSAGGNIWGQGYVSGTAHGTRPQTVKEVLLDDNKRTPNFYDCMAFNRVLLSDSDAIEFTEQDLQKLFYDQGIVAKGKTIGSLEDKKFLAYYARGSLVIAASRRIAVERLKNVIDSYGVFCKNNSFCLVAKYYYQLRTQTGKLEIDSTTQEIRQLISPEEYRTAVKNEMYDPILDSIFAK